MNRRVNNTRNVEVPRHDGVKGSRTADKRDVGTLPLEAAGLKR
jgi:hypothetical protein